MPDAGQTLEETAVQHAAMQAQKIISLNKFIFLSVISFGLYPIWWMFEAWRFFMQKDRLDIMPAARAVFALIFLYRLLDEIKDYADVEKNYTYRDRLRSFNVGHSAIYAGGIASEQKINPKLKMEYAMFPDKNNKDVAMVSAYPGYFIGSSSDTKQKEACIRFLKYMLSEKVQTKIWKKTGQIPSNPNVNIADLSGQNDVIYEAYAKLKKADIIRELPGNDWDFEQREEFEANIFRYLSGDISEDEIVDSLKSK